jgi:hypothetical protein
MVFSLHIRRARVGICLLVGITLAAGIANTAIAGEPLEGCEPAWYPFTSGEQIGANGPTNATTVWNGDLIAGGEFTTAGGQTVNNIARWDGSAWHPFTSGGQIGVNGTVRAVTVWNGDLIVGGSFTTVGGQTVNRIARWDGSVWHPLTSGGEIGVNNHVFALTVWNGNLIAGGHFATAGGQNVFNIARWDGLAWHPFTSLGVTGLPEEVLALTVWNGDLIAGGTFDFASGFQSVNGIARWDGETWHPFTSGGEIGVGCCHVYSLTVWNGNLIAGGFITTAGGQTVNHITRWDGSAWHPFTSPCGQIGVNGEVRALTVWSGDLIVGGWFTTAGDQTVNRIARWDGSAWHASIAGGEIGVNNFVNALTVWNGLPVAAGQFTMAGGQTVNRIATWDGCLIPVGACCINGVALDVPISESSCLAVNGSYQGDFTLPGDVECAPSCAADLTGDGVVDGADLLQLLTAWGMCP